MNKLTKRSDVCKLIGVTRRKLQWYNQIGLLSPSYIDEISGFWYYNDEAIMKLRVIEVLHELNYKNEKIDEIINSNDKEQEWDNVIDELNKKKEEIDGQIILINIFKNMDSKLQSSPEYLNELVYEFDILPLFYALNFAFTNGKTFVGDFKEDIKKMSSLKTIFESNNIYDNVEISVFFNYTSEICYVLLIIAGLYKNINYSDSRVQKCIDYLFSIKPDLIIDNNDAKNIILSTLQVFISDDTIYNTLYTEKGEGVFDYIIEAIKYYINHIFDFLDNN